jgi:hypothetical protein
MKNLFAMNKMNNNNSKITDSQANNHLWMSSPTSPSGFVGLAFNPAMNPSNDNPIVKKTLPMVDLSILTT